MGKKLWTWVLPGYHFIGKVLRQNQGRPWEMLAVQTKKKNPKEKEKQNLSFDHFGAFSLLYLHKARVLR